MKKKVILILLLFYFILPDFSQNIIVKSKQSSPTHSFDVLNYKLYLDLYNCHSDTFPKKYYATNTITFKADSTLNSIKLNAVNTSLTIDSVRLAGVSFFHASNILTITLDKTYYPGDTAEVKIYYHHKDIIDYYSDSAFYACNDGFVFTNCEPEGARKWFPCWDKPNDKATTDLTAKVPLNVKLGSNGSLKDSVIIGDTIYYHWASRDPMSTYLVMIASRANYLLQKIYWHKPSNQNDSIPVVFYYSSGENISPLRDSVFSVLNFYSEIFGEYKFEKLGYAGLDSIMPNWMENQTLISMAQGAWIYGTETHETAHQWFGDLITLKTWADIFLNEGFATYISALWQEHLSGYSHYKYIIDNDANYYLSNNPGWPISDSSWAIHTPPNEILFNGYISYLKGACVLHMLRYVVGDSLFFKALKEYATDPNFMFGNASICDFRDKVEAVTGQDLHWFFDEWIFKPNHPIYQNVYTITDVGGGNWKLDFLLKQIQTNPPFFKMPIELSYKCDGDPYTTVKVMNDANNQVFSFNLTKKPRFVYFDYNNNIVLKIANTVSGIEEIENKTNYFLSQNEPNPFSYSTTIKYSLPVNTFIKLKVLDIFGKEILTLFDEYEVSGNYQRTFYNNKLPQGIYFYKLETPEFSVTKKMIIVR